MTAAYDTLCDIRIHHDYYEGGICRGLGFIPADRQISTDAFGLQLRPLDGGFTVLYDRIKLHNVKSAGCAGLEGIDYCVFAYGLDPSFHIVSQDDFMNAPAIPCYAAQPKSRQMEKQNVPGDADDEYARSAAAGRRRMAFTIRIVRSFEDAEDPAGRLYTLSLQGRKTFWRYIVTGAAEEEEIAVRDPSGEVMFVGRPPMDMGRGGIGRVFDSDRPLLMSERSPFRFQMIGRRSTAERILMKRLPAASPGTVHRSENDRKDQIFSFIHINL